MSIPAISSSLGGIQSAQAQMNSAAATIAGAGLPGVQSGDLVDGVVDAKTADVAMQVNLKMLRAAMDSEKYLVDILVR